MKKILVLALLLSNIIFASNLDVPMKITLKDNTYSIKSNCSYKKRYEFIFESKYNIFENYKLLNDNFYDLISFVTDLYTIKPFRDYADNKSVIHLFLEEEDFKNIFKSSSVKINFDSKLFSSSLLEKEYKKYRPNDNHFIYNYEYYVKPSITLSLDKNDLKYYLNECNKEYSQYLAEQKEEEVEKEQKKKKEFMMIIAVSIVGIILLIITIKFIIKFTKRTKEKVIIKVDEIKKEKRKDEIKTLIADETIKETIKKSFEFSEKNNINELQEAISKALKRNDVVEAQKLMDILKKITY